MLLGMIQIQPYWWLLIIFIAILHWRGKKEKLVSGLLAAYLFLLLVVTVLSRHGPVIDPYGKFQLIPFWSYVQAAKERNTYIVKQIILNYVIFVPVGVLMYLRKINVRKTVLFGFLFSFCIETLQLLLQLGLFEIDDIIGNTIGCLIGAMASHCVYRVITEKNESSCKNLS